MPPTSETRIRGVIHGVTALVLFVLAAVARERPGVPVVLFALREPLLASGLIALLTLLLRNPGWLRRLSTRVCLGTLSLVVTVGLVEAAFRLARFDFRQQQARLERVPPYWRLPRVPTGTVFFRRRGHLAWTGQVVRAELERSRLPTAAYANEPTVTVRYDAYGFRNEPRPEAWEIAIAGDSFTELGFVPYDALFTTVLGRRLGCRVLNLGVAGTGPLSYLSYLEDHGVSPATRDVVVVFFEGNDLDNLLDEYHAEQRFERSGERPFRPIQPQTSLLHAFGDWLAEPRGRPSEGKIGVDAVFQGRDGELPVTLGFPPPGREQLGEPILEALTDFVRRYATFAGRHELRAWLAYMPCKLRVINGRMRFTKEAAPFLRAWQPSDLPEVIAELCAAAEIRFVDLTPALLRHTQETGEMVFNHLFDNHLNARGSRIVGETLARVFCEARLPGDER